MDPIQITVVRTYVEYPKAARPEDVAGYMLYLQVINRKQYRFDSEVVVGTKIRGYFYINSRDYKHITYEDYLKSRNEEVDDGGDSNTESLT